MGRRKKDEAAPAPAVQKEFVKDAELESLIHKVIKAEDLDIADAKICGLQVKPSISDSVAGRCIRSGKELKFFSGYDYIIEVSNELWNVIDEQTRYLLVYHELLHIEIKYKKDSSVVYGIRDHDIKDFKVIIKKYGVDWISELELINSTLMPEGKECELKL